jgi:hypothetical protein
MGKNRITAVLTAPFKDVSVKATTRTGATFFLVLTPEQRKAMAPVIDSDQLVALTGEKLADGQFVVNSWQLALQT